MTNSIYSNTDFDTFILPIFFFLLSNESIIDDKQCTSIRILNKIRRTDLFLIESSWFFICIWVRMFTDDLSLSLYPHHIDEEKQKREKKTRIDIVQIRYLNVLQPNNTANNDSSKCCHGPIGSLLLLFLREIESFHSQFAYLWRTRFLLNNSPQFCQSLYIYTCNDTT